MNGIEIALCGAAALLLGACGRGEPIAARLPDPRPVTVATAMVTRPQPGGSVMGVATPYREERIGFEVGGRVSSVVELGKELEGPVLGDDDRPLVGREGEPIASIDATRFEQALRAAQLSLASARKGLEARRIDAEIAGTADLEQAAAQERIAGQDLAAAQAAAKTTAAQLARTQEQFAQGIAAQAQLESDTSANDSAVARLESARAALRSATSGLGAARARARLKQAQVEQAEAEIEELKQRVTQAESDLADCTVRAPFAGRITVVHVATGGHVQPGTAVVTLTAMNPMKVSVTVSAARSRDLLQGDQVMLAPRDLGDFSDDGFLPGVVFGKAEVADPATRTHRIDIMVRNLRRSRTPRQLDGKQVYGVDHVMPVLHEEVGRGPLFVGTRCVLEEGGEAFVYRLPSSAGFHAQGRRLDGVLRPERVRIRPGARRMTIVNYKFVALDDAADLAEGDALIEDPRPELLEGVTLERFDWAIRPGDLVPVVLGRDQLPPGIYVPIEAVSLLGEDHRVFVVDGDRCRAVAVTVHESAGRLRRIEGEGVAPGDRIVVEGAHYVTDGDRVTIVDSVF